MSPFLSLIIPTLNEEEYLPNLLSDLTQQSYTDFEVLVIDGNSDDKTQDKSMPYFQKLAGEFSVVDKCNVSYQRNHGAAIAQGKYLFFIDADSRLQKNSLEKLVKEINDSRYLIYIPTALPDTDDYQDEIYLKVINYGVELSQSMGKPFASAGTFVIETNFFKHLQGFNETLFVAEDQEIIQRAKEYGVSAKFMKDVTFQFSMRRLKKDGLAQTLYKYSVAVFYTLTNGGLDKKLFEYEMGGKRYKDKPSKDNFSEIHNLYKKLKKQLES
ncbi:MAG: glycosyltransferase [Weeksellaceae bacterium]